MKNIFKNSDYHLDEIVFENRNRSYGAYNLRAESDRVLTKAMFMGIGLFACLALSPVVINALHTSEKPSSVPVGSGPFIIKNVDEPADPPVQQTSAQPATPVQTYDSTVPTPTANPVQERDPVTIDRSTAAPGFENIAGDPPVISVIPPVIDAVPGPVSTAPAVPAPVDNTPKTVVDVAADFNGGINAFRQKFVNGFDSSAMDGSGATLKTVLTFIVEKDGTISGVKATGPDAAFNREAEKTIRMIKGKWTPAKLNGAQVRSYFKFPVTMQFE